MLVYERRVGSICQRIDQRAFVLLDHETSPHCTTRNLELSGISTTTVCCPTSRSGEKRCGTVMRMINHAEWPEEPHDCALAD